VETEIKISLYTENSTELFAPSGNFTKARRALATLVAQLFSCWDGEHCFIRERAHWQLFCCGNRKVAA
jgi:hypothetical protein